MCEKIVVKNNELIKSTFFTLESNNKIISSNYCMQAGTYVIVTYNIDK